MGRAEIGGGEVIITSQLVFHLVSHDDSAEGCSGTTI